MSFRRQFYIKEEDAHLLPEKVQIQYEDTTYWTYLTTDLASCYICHQTGHISRDCPKSKQSEPTDVSTQQQELTNEVRRDTLGGSTIDDPQNIPLPLSPLANTKRTLSTASSGASAETSGDTNSPIQELHTPIDPYPLPPEFIVKESTMHTRRRTTTTNSDDAKFNFIETALNPASPYFDDHRDRLNITFSQFTDLIKTDIKAINAEELIRRIPKIVDIIDNIYPLITESKMKSKLTRIKNKIKLPEKEITKMDHIEKVETDDDNDSDFSTLKNGITN
ncbi:hypothetical protein QAD02_005395 [Eretmocerus hayati]|uniref:Uncharacterized protein n=1 Tax=Eretmocerus hayati TaxID=131215 RepID=A0ACC2NTG2_9HYME|nr:hypothetical protein QAD02_005395 [Eretmocerus hayati]